MSVIKRVFASHPAGLLGWAKLQAAKLRSLLDPFESSDNLSLYFVANISPVVRCGFENIG